MTLNGKEKRRTEDANIINSANFISFPDYITHNIEFCYFITKILLLSCFSAIAMHYFPTLYQHLYEMEDGETPSGGAIRYGFDENVFPEYLWKGYAIFSKIQVRLLSGFPLLESVFLTYTFSFVCFADNRPF